MTDYELKMVLRDLASRYSQIRSLLTDASHPTALIFADLKDNFEPASFKQIQQNPDWWKRAQKPHPNVTNTLEMQSSNSSDALLMSIFCHPQVLDWKGIRQLLNVSAAVPKFGIKALVAKGNNRGDETEIDMGIGDLFVESKLTEKDFTQKEASVVEEYVDLDKQFHKKYLRRERGNFDNYQIIGNLLAATQHNKRHILLCDERRPDLVQRYMETVYCARDIHTRNKCRVVFWQQIGKACGASLSQFLEEKYGF